MIFATVTVLILIGQPRQCTSADLRTALWLSFAIHISSFFLLLFHFIGLGFILRKLGRALGIYYFLLVGAMLLT